MTNGKSETTESPLTPGNDDSSARNSAQKRMQRGDKTESTEIVNTQTPFQNVHQKAITRGLREYFDKVTSEPIPDEFLHILKKMDAREVGECPHLPRRRRLTHRKILPRARPIRTRPTQKHFAMALSR